jgi:hypothetical protein
LYLHIFLLALYVKSPIIPEQPQSDSASQSLGLFSTISGLLTRSPKPKANRPSSPAPNQAKGTKDVDMPTRASTPNEPAQVGEPEADDPEEEDEDEDLPEEEYEVDKVIDHRPGPPVSVCDQSALI